MMDIRDETPEDYADVYRVNVIAFGQQGEAALVERLRVACEYVSLVAVEDDGVVGHIFFSPVTVESEGATFEAVGLGPMAVLPEYQGRGVGSQLVRRGLEECARRGHEIVFVVGHPEFYPSFGFTPAPSRGLTCEYPVPDEVFMVAELREGALAGRTGLVKYRPEFAGV